PDGRARFDLDTIRTFTTVEPLKEDQFLMAVTTESVPPGLYDVRLVIEQRGADSVRRTGEDTSGFAPAIAAQRGALVGLDSVEVPDPASSRLGLSDIILGRPGSGLTWTPPGGAPVPLNPLNAFPPGGTVALYYQVSGLAPGARYRTDVSLAPADDPKGRAVVTLSFTDRAASRWTEVRRTVGLAQLKPGHYRLTVKVAGPNGETATRSGLVNIVKE
ncbi:MAG TPA: hypothetical protein VFL95_02765, partial [Gemmatimonadales bacterium]|nr:hypothetical protein [Gemmatimonadales bacterium]